MRELHSVERMLILGGIVAALVFAMTHLRGPLDGPAWRQATTAYMAYRMAQESPPDILHPKVVYRGADEVRVSEFPLYSFAVALVYKAMGVDESLAAARLVTLAFYVGAAIYLFLAVRIILGARTAWYALQLFSILPLGLFYARSVHYDISLIFFSHGFFYHALQFIEGRSRRHFMLGTLMCTVAFMMKAPYAYYFGFPLAAHVVSRRPGRRMSDLFWLGAMFLLPLAAACGFNEYRIFTEGQAPESAVKIQKWTHASSLNWFFGRDGRMDPALWKMAVGRWFFSVFTPAGALAAVLALLISWRRERMAGLLTVLAWWFGMLTFTLLVFPLVASPHNYYSLPYVAPAAVTIALFLERLARADRGGFNVLSLVRTGLYLAAIGIGVIQGMQKGPFLMEGGCFWRDWQYLEAGRVIRENTAPGDVILVTAKGRRTGGTNPVLLHAAKRRGFMTYFDDLTPERFNLYRGADARWGALLITPAHQATTANMTVFASYPYTMFPLTNPAGKAIGNLLLFDLKTEPATRAVGG
ncbi:MAG: glycosyltransferase family 39 protein [Phycisphaerae bacterium]|nr:glycosyltransferase family 39 protein [Phycisphaerae bacterium]